MATPIPINQCAFTIAEVVEATGGTLVRASSSSSITGTARGVSIDTRSISAGAIFVAFAAPAQTVTTISRKPPRAARAAVVAAGRHHPALDCIEVGDTLDALGRLAHHHLERTRASCALPLIAVGGAVGKTTTKELTAAVVRAIFGSTLSTPGNLNNLIGVPMTIFTLTGNHRAAVLECGTNTRGEIPKLARIVVPDVAMVLNVDLEHSEGLGTLDEIADEEAAFSQPPAATRSLPPTSRWSCRGFQKICATSLLANLPTLTCGSSVEAPPPARASRSKLRATWSPVESNLP